MQNCLDECDHVSPTSYEICELRFYPPKKSSATCILGDLEALVKLEMFATLEYEGDCCLGISP